MAKGDDAVRRKKSKTNRKRMRNSESAVSARVASIIAAKRRRKSGKRKICEGMCFSLPTPDDPFNDRHHKKKTNDDDNSKKDKPNTRKRGEESEKNRSKSTLQLNNKAAADIDGNFNNGCIPKFLILCLNAIHNYWKDQQQQQEVENNNMRRSHHPLASSWGAQLWQRCSSGQDLLVDSIADCASNELLAWLLSTASDIITTREKQGQVLPTPFLLFLVPSQQKAIQVRSACKPLKSLGIHTVSLHPGALIDHQIHGLKSCEPEFVVATPDRLLELVLLRAIDISGASLLVLDGLTNLVDSGFSDKIERIKENISGKHQVVIFGDCSEDISRSLSENLLSEPVSRLSLDDCGLSKHI